jgi:PilZ domain
MTGSELRNMPPAKRDQRMNPDRRSHRRYLVSVNLEYSLSLPEGHLQVGRGRTINLSSGGVLFETAATVPVNTTVEMSISWPLRSEYQVQFELHVRGKTVRAKDRQVAVKFDQCIFRTTTARKDKGIDGNSR